MRLKRFLCHVFAYFAACELAGLIMSTVSEFNLHRENALHRWTIDLSFVTAYGTLKDIIEGSLLFFVGSAILCLIPVLVTIFIAQFLARRHHLWLFPLFGGLTPIAFIIMVEEGLPPLNRDTTILITIGALSGLAYYLVLCYLHSKWIKPPAIDVAVFD